MSYTIAIAGKGGTGKTTVAALLVTRLVARGRRPVLAVDADPNSCLDAALGVRATKTVGAVREDLRRIAGEGLGTGVSKQQLLRLKIAESLVETDDFDLIAMGRPEGQGCYCYANNVLKEVITQLADGYPVVVIDNEAGLENLSRRLVRRADLLLMMTDPSQSGLQTVERLYDLAHEMKLQYARLAIVFNRLRHDGLPAGAVALQQRVHADLLLGLPDDPQLAELAENGGRVPTNCDAGSLPQRVDRFLIEVGL